MKNSQKGFVVPLLIAIIAVLVIGGGIYVYENNKVESPISPINLSTTTVMPNNYQETTSQTSNTQVSITQNQSSEISTTSPISQLTTTMGWKVYKNSQFGLSFMYPSNSAVTDISSISLDPTMPAVEIEVPVDSGTGHITFIASVEDQSPTSSTTCNYYDNKHLQEEPLNFQTYSRVTINGINYFRQQYLEPTAYDFGGDDYSYNADYNTTNADNRCYSFLLIIPNPNYKVGITDKSSLTNLAIDPAEMNIFNEIMKTVTISKTNL